MISQSIRLWILPLHWHPNRRVSSRFLARPTSSSHFHLRHPSHLSHVTSKISRNISILPTMERPSKKARVSSDSTGDLETEGRPRRTETPLNSLNRSISPPLRTRSQPTQPATDLACPELANDVLKTADSKQTLDITRPSGPARCIPSPVQLTHIADYPASKGYNVDAVRLRDILGDPMIRECWQFNYMFDVDFLMKQFDEDVRGLVTVKVVHGSWKKESPNRIMIDVSFTTPETTYV